MQPLARTLLPDLARLAVVSFLALSLAVLSGCGETGSEPETAVQDAPTALPTATPVLPVATAIPPIATTVPATFTPTPVVSKWHYGSQTDSLTGQQRYAAGLPATSRTGYGDETPWLHFRCTVGEPQWESYISWREFIGGDEVLVRYRLGSLPIVTRIWGRGADNSTTFLPRGRVHRFVQLLSYQSTSGHTRLVVRVWRHDEQTITATWDVTGLTAALQPLREHCQE